MGSAGHWRRGTSQQIEREIDQAERRGTLLAAQAGTARRTLRRRCATGLLIEPYAGLFARAEHWESLSSWQQTIQLMRGITRLHPTRVFCCQSAAVAHGLPVASWHLHELHLAIPQHTARKQQPGIVYHHLEPQSIVTTMGIRATTLEQTVLDCACTLPLCDALAVADAALRLYDLNRSALEQHAKAHGTGRCGIRWARHVLQLADSASESWGESYARGLLYMLGYTLPELQVEIDLPPHLGGTRRVDFMWRLPGGGTVIGEFDGKEKYHEDDRVDLGAFYRERQRESRLSITGALIMRFGFDDLKEPERFSRLLDAYGVPRALSPSTCRMPQ